MASMNDISMPFMSPPSMMSPSMSFESSPRFRSICLGTSPATLSLDFTNMASFTYLCRRKSATPLPSHFDKRFSFFTGIDAEQLLDLLQEALIQHALDAEVDTPRWRVKASNAFVHLCVHVFEARDDDCRAVEFQLRQGDRGAFRALVVDVVDSLELIDLEPASTPSALFDFRPEQMPAAQDGLSMPSLIPPSYSIQLSHSLLDTVLDGIRAPFVDVQTESLSILAKTVPVSPAASRLLALHSAVLKAVVACMTSSCERVSAMAMNVVVALVQQHQQQALLNVGVMEALLTVLEPTSPSQSQKTLRQALRCLTMVQGIDQHPSWSRIAECMRRLHMSASESLRRLVETLLPSLKDRATCVGHTLSKPMSIYSRSL